MCHIVICQQNYLSSSDESLQTSGGSDKLISNENQVMNALNGVGQTALQGASNIINAFPEDYKNQIKNITNDINGNDLKHAIQSVHPIVTSVVNEKGSADYTEIANKWVTQNPLFASKLASLMSFISNKTMTLPQIDQEFISNWTQSHQILLQKLSSGNVSEQELNQSWKESLEQLMNIPENDRKQFDTVIPGLGSLFVDPNFVSRATNAVSNTTSDTLKDVNNYIFSKITNFALGSNSS